MRWAVKPVAVGRRVRARKIKDDQPLSPSETFTVSVGVDVPSLVLAEDEQSLREPTQTELDKMAVPPQVTALQARRALEQVGIRSDVETFVSNQPQDVQDHWTYATVIERDSQFIADAATALGLTEQDLDDLFTQAVQL